VVFIVAYVVGFWAIALVHRRRWPAFMALLVSIPLTMLLAHVFVMLTPMVGPATDPSPEWMYVVGAAIEGLILLVGVTVAVQPRRRVERPCGRCRYDLDGLTQGRCPECGRVFDKASAERTAHVDLSPSLITGSPRPASARPADRPAR
jgi:uncharacterized C2H2 Zn-finger protein